MNYKDNGGDSLQPKDTPSTGAEPNQKIAELPEAGPEDASPSISISTKNENGEAVEATKQQEDAHESSKSVSVKEPQSFFGERPLTAIEMAPRVLRYQSRRDFLVFGAGALAALAGA